MNPEDRLESSTRLKLLFVDADKRVLNSLRAMFRHDHDVVIATHVHEALQALDEAPMDVVVADDHLPDTNGLDLLHWVRLRAPEAARILLVSAGEQPYDAATIGRAQLFRVLAKPCAPDVLRATIGQAGRTARVGRASALVRAAASATQPDVAANDSPPEDIEGTRPVLSLRDEDSGLHRTLDGAEHTFGGTPRNADGASTGDTPLADNDAPPANTDSDVLGDGSTLAHVPSGDASAPQGARADTSADGADPLQTSADQMTDEQSRPVTTRVWSSHGITVEEDAYDDPTDTQRVFASMLEGKTTHPPEAAAGVSPAVQVTAPAATSGNSVLPQTPLADDTPAVTGGTRRIASALTTADEAPAAQPRPVVPVEVLLLSDDAITRAELRRSLERVHVVVDAGSPDAALNAICESCCSVVLLDGRGRAPRSIERTARTLLGAAPELSILVFAEVAESPALFELPARVPGIVSLLYALPTQAQLMGALAWAQAVTCHETQQTVPARLMLDVPSSTHDTLPSATNPAPGGGLLGDRLRRVSRFMTGGHDD